MNTKHYYLSLLRTFALATLTAAAVTACTDDTDNDREPLTPPDGIPVTFTANINPGSDAAPAAAPGTRTILTPTPEGGFTVKWRGKDNPDGTDWICIWAAKDNTLTKQSSTKYVPTTSAASSALVPRNDQNPLTVPSTGEWKFTAVYGEYGSGNGMATAVVSPQTQSVPGDNKHIARYDFSIATAKQHVDIDNEMPRSISLGFKHMLSAMQLHVTNATGEALTVREIRLSAAGGQIAYYRAYDVATGNWKADQERKSDYLKLKIENPAALATGGASQNFHMLFFPGYANTDMTITVITDRGEFTLTKTAPASPGFIAGKNYMTNIAIKSNPGTGETWSEHVGISTADDLAAFCDRVNGGDNYQGKTVRLLNDITLTGTWTPIGNSTNKFQGTFDGGGYSISDMTMARSSDYAGLFGYVDGGAVRNLRVKGSVGATSFYVGGIVGRLENSSVENCIFDGTVSGNKNVGGIAGYLENNSQIAGCYTKGSVTALSDNVGGIAGNNGRNCIITDCYSGATVEANGSGAGGIVGFNDKTVTHCYATGAISSGDWQAGGIAGYNSSNTVTGCIALNPGITRTLGDRTAFGRIVGYNDGGTAADCFAFKDMTITDATSSQPIANRTGSIDGDDLTAANCLNETTYTGRGFTTTDGWGFDTGVTWTYLPWNKAFESFHNISETDYRISVPQHLNGGSNVN